MCTSASFSGPIRAPNSQTCDIADALTACGIHVSGVGDRRRIDLARQLVAEEAVELPVAHDVQRRGRNVVALLIARGDEAGAHVDADVRLAEPVAEHRRAAAVGRDAQHAAVVLADASSPPGRPWR